MTPRYVLPHLGSTKIAKPILGVSFYPPQCYRSLVLGNDYCTHPDCCTYVTGTSEAYRRVELVPFHCIPPQTAGFCSPLPSPAGCRASNLKLASSRRVTTAPCTVPDSELGTSDLTQLCFDQLFKCLMHGYIILCASVHSDTHLYTYTSPHTYTYTHTYTQICIYIYTHMYIYANTFYTYVYTCLYLYADTQVSTQHTRLHTASICMYTHNTYIYIYMYMCT